MSLIIEISIGDAILFHNLLVEEIDLLENEKDDVFFDLQQIIKSRKQTAKELLEKIEKKL